MLKIEKFVQSFQQFEEKMSFYTHWTHFDYSFFEKMAKNQIHKNEMSKNGLRKTIIAKTRHLEYQKFINWFQKAEEHF